jgi:hypothetical protein
MRRALGPATLAAMLLVIAHPPSGASGALRSGPLVLAPPPPAEAPAAPIDTPPPAEAPAAPIDTPPPNCAASLDPYAYTAAALTACGYTVFPRTGQTALPGGGYAVAYADGSAQLVPPAGFRPLTATPAQLAEYGLPTQPIDDLGAAAAWQGEMSSFHPAAPPAFDVEDPYATVGTSPTRTFVGYYLGGRADFATHAEMWYQEPTAHSSGCRGNDEAVWPGLQNGTGALAQDGTASGLSGLGNHQAWYFAGSSGYHPTAVPLHGHAGFEFDASVRRLTDSTYRLYMYDYATGTAWSKNVALRSNPTRAEFILERQPGTPLMNYRRLLVHSAYVNDFPFNQNPNGYNAFSMTDDSGQTMADVTFLGGRGSFEFNQYHCL